ncbi:hypothetical protein IMY05_006G0005300 [Salix suchowensis]|nr:hypothetical protein IMY05_006G0005300 [Salix suchowensis]
MPRHTCNGPNFCYSLTYTFCSDISIRWDPQILLSGKKYVQQVEPEFLPDCWIPIKKKKKKLKLD